MIKKNYETSFTYNPIYSNQKKPSCKESWEAKNLAVKRKSRNVKS